MNPTDAPSPEPRPPWIEMTPGVRRRTLVSGGAMMQMLVTLAAGSRLAEHRHPHVQVAFVVSGRLRFVLGGGETRDLAAGESIYLESNVPHGVEALEESVVVDTFNPPREDLLAQDRAQAESAERA